jgi:hypothetical protein
MQRLFHGWHYMQSRRSASSNFDSQGSHRACRTSASTMRSPSQASYSRLRPQQLGRNIGKGGRRRRYEPGTIRGFPVRWSTSRSTSFAGRLADQGISILPSPYDPTWIPDATVVWASWSCICHADANATSWPLQSPDTSSFPASPSPHGPPSTAITYCSCT